MTARLPSASSRRSSVSASAAAPINLARKPWQDVFDYVEMAYYPVRKLGQERVLSTVEPERLPILKAKGVWKTRGCSAKTDSSAAQTCSAFHAFDETSIRHFCRSTDVCR